jgi:hypothetical protein
MKTASGHILSARVAGIADRTPKSRASYDATQTTERFAAPAYDYRSTPQLGVVPLFDRTVERVHVNVNYLPKCRRFAHRVFNGAERYSHAAMLASGIEQERNEDGSASAPHPSWKPHPMQGWSPDFIAKLAGDAISSNAISQVLRITNADAMRCSKELAKKEGIFVGITSGGRSQGHCRWPRRHIKERPLSAWCRIPASAV